MLFSVQRLRSGYPFPFPKERRLTFLRKRSILNRIRCILCDSIWRENMIQNTQFRAASLIVQLGNAVTYYRNLKMEHIGLTSVQSDALIAALRNPGITAARLKEQLQLSQSTVAGILSRLEGKGLIEKKADQEDARKAILTPTDQGLALEMPLKEIALETQQSLVEGMSEAEQEEFIRLLDIALENMNRVRQAQPSGGR
ncbi:MarR family transcriptional regulator [Pseudoflavonifractor sp. MCC625]|nr:MarR family transcriptional regulator [Pseudoflavonifractor sp. MCC625]